MLGQEFACSVIHKALGQCGKAKKASGKKKRAGSVIGKEQREERRREPVNIFSNASIRPLAEKPFLVSKRQKVRWCSRV